ncbi:MULTISPECIES: copper resistance CopC family protein [Microbacterium]|uniref:copper resistance CopC family protein n=1 Tax=Microbacterium TaxID=33882 RepID=UPI0011EB007F|nr:MULTISPECIES: copper resistance CopC family protein [Microbacterium]
MKTKAQRRPVAPIVLAASLLAAFLVFFSPLSASAHDALLSSSPAADSTVETLPSSLTLTFNAQLIDGERATELVVTDPTGASVIDGSPSVEGAIVTQPLRGSGPAGEYRVVWKVVSSDGHPTSGEFSFTVTVGDEEATTEEPSAVPTTAAPTAEQTATPEATPTSGSESEDGSTEAAPAWVWVIAIVVALLVLGVVVWLVLRSRRGGAGPGSGTPSER